MGISEHISEHDAYKSIVESIDTIVQIRILHDVRRVTSIVRVEKDLKGGRPWYTPVFRFDENSPADAPSWEQVQESDA